MSIANNISTLKNTLPAHVDLVAVSKTKPEADILEAYQAGQRIFGENKIQEMAGKWANLPKDIQWHMIGHVQRNKVKYMAEFVTVIHAVDSFKLLKEINKQALKHDRVIQCLLQVKIAQEDSKFGMTPAQVIALLEHPELALLANVSIIGFMGMATFTNDQAQLKQEFMVLKSLFDEQQSQFQLSTLSMGMSGDYPLAIDCGSTMIRVGSAIFGARNYTQS